jgi:hypothetical protein
LCLRARVRVRAFVCAYVALYVCVYLFLALACVVRADACVCVRACRCRTAGAADSLQDERQLDEENAHTRRCCGARLRVPCSRPVVPRAALRVRAAHCWAMGPAQEAQRIVGLNQQLGSGFGVAQVCRVLCVFVCVFLCVCVRARICREVSEIHVCALAQINFAVEHWNEAPTYSIELYGPAAGGGAARRPPRSCGARGEGALMNGACARAGDLQACSATRSAARRSLTPCA